MRIRPMAERCEVWDWYFYLRTHSSWWHFLKHGGLTLNSFWIWTSFRRAQSVCQSLNFVWLPSRLAFWAETVLAQERSVRLGMHAIMSPIPKVFGCVRERPLTGSRAERQQILVWAHCVGGRSAVLHTHSFFKPHWPVFQWDLMPPYALNFHPQFSHLHFSSFLKNNSPIEWGLKLLNLKKPIKVSYN